MTNAKFTILIIVLCAIAFYLLLIVSQLDGISKAIHAQ